MIPSPTASGPSKEAMEAAHALMRSRCRFVPGQDETHSSLCDDVARAIDAAFKRGQAAEWEAAANVCQSMIIGGHAWEHDQEVAAKALEAAAKNIRAGVDPAGEDEPSKCNCNPADNTGGGHSGTCPEFEAECTCYPEEIPHMVGCYFNRKPARTP